jgi:hypothetical protein
MTQPSTISVERLTPGIRKITFSKWLSCLP